MVQSNAVSSIQRWSETSEPVANLEYDLAEIVDRSRPKSAIELLSPERSRSRGIRKQAKMLSPEEIVRLFTHIERTSNAPVADRLKFALSLYAGLRAAEIAALTIADVTTASGKIATSIVVSAATAKNSCRREIPMHPVIRDALEAFRKRYPTADRLAITSRYGRNWIPQKTNALTQQMRRIYHAIGFTECSSHSGRRTFITVASRKTAEVGGSLRDVQVLAGHARLDTTQRYLEPSAHLSRLVHLI